MTSDVTANVSRFRWAFLPEWLRPTKFVILMACSLANEPGIYENNIMVMINN